MIEKDRKSHPGPNRSGTRKTSNNLLFPLLLVFVQGCAVPFEPHANKSSRSVGSGEDAVEVASPDSAAPNLAPEPPPHAENNGESAWQIQWTSDCEKNGSENPKSCAGGYGFTISEDGAYEIGPGPNGQKLNGHITQEDQERIQREIDRISREHEKSSECADEAESGMRLPHYFAFFKSHETRDLKCVTSLRELIQELTEKYAPSAFPTPCSDAIWDLNGLYESIRECGTDSDCENLDPDFKPRPWSTDGEFSTASCDSVPELKVANGFRAVTWQLELLLKREIAREVCSSTGLMPGCVPGAPRFETFRQPRCVQKRCSP